MNSYCYNNLTLFRVQYNLHIYTYIHTYIHTNIHRYKHTYIHTYIHTYMPPLCAVPGSRCRLRAGAEATLRQELCKPLRGGVCLRV